ncbi:ABC transporter ATP-binding protein [Kibdelosporangium phytohabitans]|uniref:ABC transporter n=1 Tax=Kibdelosporangium phytohabitans TaxID=860235 RepID=A0A0N9I0K0_9PSEU|nr:ABC transporter ATP-binding protein [Kibdelosporangium phytohabitans]ALG13240.1 ABC transporter [Kibdelosporangium phytohabitans]MBE1465008.1 ABC-2 type transport system ATP-binding protein [Kibdelosporangium phytohabitans]
MTGNGGDAIVVSGIRKSYGDLTAVDGVSFTVAEGEFFGILGPNGAGKTTTLEMVEGLREPDAGSVTLLGQNPWPRKLDLLPRIGVQLQASAFFDKLTAREQLETFSSLYGSGTKNIDEMLEVVGLADKANTREDKLSGGQRQRLSIACALAHDPDIVFLDEPTAALDPQARRNLWDVLREIRSRGKTIVYTTHYLDEAEILCDRVAIMDHGTILAMDTPAALVRGLDAPTHIMLEHGALRLDEVRGFTGVDDATDDGTTLTISTRKPAPVLGALAERGTLDGLQVRTATLEDVFLDLTGREYRA